MGENTFRNAPGASGVREASAGPGPATNYSRRRFVVLAIGLTALAGAAWSLSESFNVHPGARASASSRDGSAGHGAGWQSGSSPGGGSRAGASRRDSAATGAVKGGGQAHGGNSPGSGPAHSPAPMPSVTAGGLGGFTPAFCSRHSLVLSLSSAQSQFGPGQQPNFRLSVTSTQPADCSFNVGPGHLALVIKEGSARIWSSADCVKGTDNLVTELRRGVPTVVAIGWNKKTSSRDCSGPAQSVPPGTYTAYAMDGSLVSAPVKIRLR